jgi:hypothetical protein
MADEVNKVLDGKADEESLVQISVSRPPSAMLL